MVRRVSDIKKLGKRHDGWHYQVDFTGIFFPFIPYPRREWRSYYEVIGQDNLADFVYKVNQKHEGYPLGVYSLQCDHPWDLVYVTSDPRVPNDTIEDWLNEIFSHAG